MLYNGFKMYLLYDIVVYYVCSYCILATSYIYHTCVFLLFIIFWMWIV